MKKISLIFVLGLIVNIVIITNTYASWQAVDSGSCGENLTWTLDSNGVLTINGQGAMVPYSPWTSHTSAIKTVVIEDGVTSIGDYAFYDCSNLTGVTIGKDVKDVGAYAFAYCDRLESITIPDNVTSIGDYVFANCEKLTSIAIGKGIESISNGAFAFCESLKHITIPNNITIIGVDAFVGCSSLAEVAIPDSVTVIEHSAFRYCDKLINVTIGEGASDISALAFSENKSLISITVDPNNKHFASIDGVLFDKSKKTLITYPMGITNTVYEIPDGVIEIGYAAFFDCTSLTNILIPDSVTSIGDLAFGFCTSLTNISIPDSITNIGDYVFEYCESLKSVTIPDGVISIGDSAFSGCNNLESITIPNSVKVISEFAFYSCDKLTDVYYYGTIEEWNDIYIGEVNDSLINANVHYLIDTTPEIAALTVSKWGTATLVELSAKNLPENHVIFIVAYKDGRFSQIKRVESDDTGKVQDYFISGGENSFKAFIWDSLQSLKPLCESKMAQFE